MGTSTVNSSPALGPEPMTRTSLALEPDGGHPAHGAERLDQGREVVRAHVEQRPGAVLEEEGRVGVPGLRPGRLERGHGRQRGADVAAFDQPPGGLQARAEEGVRGAAEPDACGVGGLEQAQPGFAVQRERLLRPDVLPGVDGGRGHLHVGGRDGQVDDDFDVGMVQRALHAAPLRDAVFLGAGRGGLLEEVGDDVDLQVGEDREVVQVLLADVPGADDGDAYRAAAGCVAVARSCVCALRAVSAFR